MNNRLPFNRSEQYFTATIFPILVAGDRFRRFDAFRRLLHGFDCPTVEPDGPNIQFLTEFSLRKALVGRAAERFTDAPGDGDTPDIVMLIEDAERRAIVMLEGKMYSIAQRSDLKRQMKRQRKLIDYLAGELGVAQKDIYQAALLAGDHRDEIGTFDFPILTWEEILDSYRASMQDNYFYKQLAEAIERFDELRGVSSSGESYGKNREAYLTGAEIVRRFRTGTLRYSVMGRNLGLNGRVLAEDVATGNWKTQNYEVNSSSTPPNRNWFLVEQFVDLVT